MGRDTMQASTKAFRTICDYHASGGTTSLLLTTATAPIKSILKVVNEVRDAKSSIKQIAGVHVEGPFISKTKPGAQRASLMRKPTRSIYRPLLNHSGVIKRMTLAPEFPGALALIDELRKRNISASGGYSDPWEDPACAAFLLRRVTATHTFNRI